MKTPESTIAVVAGSVRPNNVTMKVASLAVSMTSELSPFPVTLVDPSKLHLALPGTSAELEASETIKNLLSPALAIIFITPEYHGTFSSIIKLVIELSGYPSVISGKPVSLIGVASGQIGAIKALEHLRSVCSHLGSIVLPWPLSIAKVHNDFDVRGNCTNSETSSKIKTLVEGLIGYVGP